MAGLAVACARGGTRLPSARRATCGSCRCSTRRRARARSTGTIPGACAPSTSTSTPRRLRAQGPAPRSGRRRRSALVTWSSSASRVRGVTAREHRLHDLSGPREREGHRATTTRAPAALGDARERVAAGVVGVVGGEQLVARGESRASGARCSRRRWRCPRRPGRPHRRGGTRRARPRASSSSGSRPRTRKSIGLPLHARASSVCSASTSRGQAPNAPWLRKVMPGSSVQCAASGEGSGRLTAACPCGAGGRR